MVIAMRLRSFIGSVVLLPLAACSSDPDASSSVPNPGIVQMNNLPPMGIPAPAGGSMPAANQQSAPAATPAEGQTNGMTPLVPSTAPMAGTNPMMVPAMMPPIPGELPTTPEEMAACTREFTMPTFAQLTANPQLPDPFTFLDGSRVTTKADWACRRKEISLLAQEFIFGRKPPPPDSLQATFANNALDITVTQGNQTVNFSVPVTRPNGDGPFPGILSLGGTTPDNVAVLNIRNASNQFAAAGGGRATTGAFYTLFPDYTSTGSLMAWAWMASRIVDALVATTGHGIDTSKLSALGCSRDGKEAATIALFDDRFAMVAAQSPGSGTTSGWRVAQEVLNGGGNVQTAAQIFGENTWLGAVFQPFGNQNVSLLPIDQHEVLALAWPRPLIMMEGTNDSWNCPLCSYTTMKYTQMIYQALGTPDAIAFPQPAHGHCAQAGTFAEQYYDTFVDRFLRGDESVSTAGLFTDGNFAFDANRWQDGALEALP
jgi:hypothetical protein